MLCSDEFNSVQHTKGIETWLNVNITTQISNWSLIETHTHMMDPNNTMKALKTEVWITKKQKADYNFLFEINQVVAW